MSSRLVYLAIVAASCLLSMASAQCASSPSATSDNANCASWLARGFCNSTFYTLAYKQQYCGFACGICGASAAPTCSSPDNSTYCASWVTRGFCRNPFYTVAQRLQFCCASCLPIIQSLATTTTAASAVTTTTTAAIADTSCATVTTTTNPATTNILNMGTATALSGTTVASVTVVRPTCTLSLLDAAGALLGTTKTADGPVAAGDPEAPATQASCTCSA